ncbi:MAG TPA: hypothetical protein VE401_07505 [Solirubrobacterales bacterium]|nr:hypothetical protein [Solirubrobacterales bacterium]
MASTPNASARDARARRGRGPAPAGGRTPPDVFFASGEDLVGTPPHEIGRETMVALAGRALRLSANAAEPSRAKPRFSVPSLGWVKF